MPSLSGASVRTEHVDAGWRIRLFAADAAPCIEWDARGVERRIVYDNQRRPVEIHEGLGESRCLDRFTYGNDPTGGTAGRLVRHDDTGGSLEMPGYSVRGDTLAERRRFLRAMDAPDWPADEPARDTFLETEVFTTCWVHDALGEPIAQVDTEGHRRRHVVDVSGQLQSLHLTLTGAEEITITSGITYDAQGRVVARRDGAVETKASFREGDGRQIRVRRVAGAKILQDLAYAYDGVGNVLSVEDAAPGTGWFDPRGTDPVQHYVYDTLDQLVEASGQESMLLDGALDRPPPLIAGTDTDNRLRNYVERYAYDAGGNLVQWSHEATGLDYVRRFDVPSDSNRAVLVDADDTPAFDATGNLLSLKRGVPMHWNTRGYLAQVGAAGGAPETYQYDSTGRRVRKRSTDGDVRYVHGWERRTAYDGSAPIDVIHISHAETAVRVIYTGSVTPPVLRIQVADILHSVTLEITADGDVLTEEAFHPYGSSARWAAREQADADTKVLRYVGKEFDASGLGYHGHRYYAPWLARWISPDPAGDIDGLNRYRFAHNNPVSGFDPDGLMVRRPDGRGGNPLAGWIVERKVRKHMQRAVASGRDAVARQLNVVSAPNGVPVDLHGALATSLRTVRHAGDVLRDDANHARGLLTGLLGVRQLSDSQWEKARESLGSGFGLIAADLEQLMGEGGSRFVLVNYPGKPYADRPKPNAFVMDGDPRRRVFINLANVQRIGMHPLSNTIIHELSHQLPGPLKTFDVLYGSELALPHGIAEFQPPRTFNALSLTGTHRAATAIGFSYLGMTTEERRTSLMLRNADTWVAISAILAREHADH